MKAGKLLGILLCAALALTVLPLGADAPAASAASAEGLPDGFQKFVFNFVDDATGEGAYKKEDGSMSHKYFQFGDPDESTTSFPNGQHSYVDAEGVHLVTNTLNSDFKSDDAKVATENGWFRNKTYVCDRDNAGTVAGDEDGFLRIKDGYVYALVAKYRPDPGVSGGLGFGLSGWPLSRMVGSTNQPNWQITDALSYENESPTGGDGYIAAVIDSAGLSRSGSGSNAKTKNGGKYVCVYARTTPNKSYVTVESVTVYVRPSNSAEKFLVQKQADGSFTVEAAVPGNLTATGKPDEYGRQPSGYLAAVREGTVGTLKTVDSFTTDTVLYAEPSYPPFPMPETSVGEVKNSIRLAKTGDSYVSAGLRFRGTLTADMMADASEIGFVVAPTDLVVNDETWYQFDGDTLKNPIARSAVCFTAGKEDIVYHAYNDGAKDYQLILTGLTTRDGRSMRDRKFAAVLYVKAAAGAYRYYGVNIASYDEVRQKLRENGFMEEYWNESAEPDAGDWRMHPQDYKLIALTFDDMPNAATPTGTAKQVVDAFAGYDGAGTMFVIGTRVNTYGVELLQYAVSHGFELGNHTYTHTDYVLNKTPISTDDYLQNEIRQNNLLLQSKMGYTMKWLRPSGLHSDADMRAACASAGMPIVCGNKTGTTSDYNASTTEKSIRDAVVNNAYDGKIVLLHGTSRNTANILPDILNTLYAKGYRFCTLSELFKYKLGVTDPAAQVDVEASVYNPSSTAGGIYDTGDVKLK